MQFDDKTETRWFVKKPDGDTYDGRMYHGRVYELIPAALPKLTLENGPACLGDGSLGFYPGSILLDSDANEVRADEGKSALKCIGMSGNLGGYAETYYTATQGQMKARVMDSPVATIIDLDCALGDGETDRKALWVFLSFIATALTAWSVGGLNLQNAKYRDYVDGDAPIPVPKPRGQSMELGQLNRPEVTGW